YREVLLEACRVASVPEDEQAYLLTLPAEHALFEIIKESLALFRDQAESHWQTAILSRECRNPGPVFEELADEYFRPQAEFLNRILSKAANRPATDFSVQFAGISVIGLMETCGLYRRYVAAVSPGLLEHGEKDDWFARQITRMVIRTASA
ncbi:MAG: DUF1956 domain-containing protein, partial [Desulfobacterales bacterium]|nr:DUF1956 domain-containing protein [Desulfobacterales bacterium]